MTDTPQVLLQHHLKKLRLPTFHSEYAKQARQCAVENKDHINYLLRLCELELIERERRMIERRIKAAKFPATKSLDSFNFKVIPSLNKVLTMQLARGEFIDRRAISSHWGQAAQVKPISPWDWVWRPARRAGKYASPLPLLSSMNSSRPSTNAACSACRNNWLARTC